MRHNELKNKVYAILVILLVVFFAWTMYDNISGIFQALVSNVLSNTNKKIEHIVLGIRG